LKGGLGRDIGKLASVRFFASTVLSQTTSKSKIIKSKYRAALEIAENAF
jgi:hypothetical protein